MYTLRIPPSERVYRIRAIAGLTLVALALRRYPPPYLLLAAALIFQLCDLYVKGYLDWACVSGDAGLHANPSCLRMSRSLRSLNDLLSRFTSNMRTRMEIILQFSCLATRETKQLAVAVLDRPACYACSFLVHVCCGTFDQDIIRDLQYIRHAWHCYRRLTGVTAVYDMCTPRRPKLYCISHQNRRLEPESSTFSGTESRKNKLRPLYLVHKVRTGLRPLHLVQLYHGEQPRRPLEAHDTQALQARIFKLFDFAKFWVIYISALVFLNVLTWFFRFGAAFLEQHEKTLISLPSPSEKSPQATEEAESSGNTPVSKELKIKTSIEYRESPEPVPFAVRRDASFFLTSSMWEFIDEDTTPSEPSPTLLTYGGRMTRYLPLLDESPCPKRQPIAKLMRMQGKKEAKECEGTVCAKDAYPTPPATPLLDGEDCFGNVLSC